jgi:hypothetical protein
MHVYYFNNTGGVGAYLMLMTDLQSAPIIHTGEWQAMDTSASMAHRTHELEDVALVWEAIPKDPAIMIPAIDVGWADEHFAERVSGKPLNPAPSHVNWPYAVRGNADHIDETTRFDHTYPERFWPKFANVGETRPNGRQVFVPHNGIRFEYGDLSDVVNLFLKHPLTRQAYLPIWFPEDTGAIDGQRVPCTLGYHFMQRGGLLSCRYYIRSVDAYRHLSNDVYFAALLMQWVCDEIERRTSGAYIPLKLKPGKLVMHIGSLHTFTGDYAKVRDRIKSVQDEDGDWGVPV